jgi:hypothetical protein
MDSEQVIHSEDMTLKRVLQDFYRVPDYQREYVWGETDPKGERGDEVDQFLNDVNTEFEAATEEQAPEYFIGTIVVCPAAGGVLELIDGQQRSTTAFLTLCAIRDYLKKLGVSLPDDLPGQIAASSTDWKGQTVHRLRLDLQYEDAGNILQDYSEGKGADARLGETRSITNMANAYKTIFEFLQANCKDDPNSVRAFYGYFTNKVKLIRITTPSVAKALKIFETINDRGVGLDAMDLLKNLLFMSAKPNEFSKLKNTWKEITDQIYSAREKPLRFLRYFLFATYRCDPRLREDGIYDWFLKNDTQTQIKASPLSFASKLLDGAEAYKHLSKGHNIAGIVEHGVTNTRILGGKSIRQHFILLLAGRHLNSSLFSRLADEIEQTMCIWLVTSTPGKEYERLIVEWAGRLRTITELDAFNAFIGETFALARTTLKEKFSVAMQSAKKTDMRAFRVRYLLAKLTQHLDLQAYGKEGGQSALAHYVDGRNDIEHILPENPSPQALLEFGEGAVDQDVTQRLGNLLLLEESVNRAIQNDAYSAKKIAYPSSQFLLTRCIAGHLPVGTNDRITRATRDIPNFETWNRKGIEARQKYLAKLSAEVWNVA